jgi:hypothetical protein
MKHSSLFHPKILELDVYITKSSHYVLCTNEKDPEEEELGPKAIKTCRGGDTAIWMVSGLLSFQAVQLRSWDI